MKIFTGKVLSTKMSKTATVVVTRMLPHPVYKKRFKIIKKYQVHDELGVKVGDRVKFVACKPYSKLKKWIIIADTKVKKVARKIATKKMLVNVKRKGSK